MNKSPPQFLALKWLIFSHLWKEGRAGCGFKSLCSALCSPICYSFFIAGLQLRNFPRAKSPCSTWHLRCGEYWTLLCYSFLRSQPVSCFEGSAQKIAQFPKGTLPLHTLRYKALTQIAHSILAHTVVFRFCALSNCAVWGEVRSSISTFSIRQDPFYPLPHKALAHYHAYTSGIYAQSTMRK